MPDSILVLGSGPIRIGQGIEFDYSCVHCVWALNEMGYRAQIINNNPETVSTDFDTGDGLFFEPVTLDDVVAVVRATGARGVVCQFGGQTAINLAEHLDAAGVSVLGTQPRAIALAEDRDQFDALLNELGIRKPRGKAVTSVADAQRVVAEVGYPVLVRPSFVLGGRAMEICFDDDQLAHFFAEAADANPGQPVLVDEYILGQEAEVDVISDGSDTLVPGVMEHIERAGVHSGDSMAVYPPVTLSGEVQVEMVRAACQIARRLDVRGLMNIQFVIRDNQAYVLEVNPRASRTVPYLSKVTGIPMVQLATQCMMGKTLKELGFVSGLWQVAAGGRPGWVMPVGDMNADALEATAPFYAVKAPVFSFQKLSKVEPSLGPEMKSTGEIMGLDFTFEAALYKALIASHVTFKSSGYVVLTLDDRDKMFAVEIAEQLRKFGIPIAATAGTHAVLQQAGIEARLVNKMLDGGENLVDLIRAGQVRLMINTPTHGKQSTIEAKLIRRTCIETGIACLTSVDTARALAKALPLYENPELSSCLPYNAYLAGRVLN
ncbi:MAG: carbamoyl-phosphate synthase large subunit [Chthonomonas sp.]|nr:carbamoyl-phosphate synthase large subunit [Chthonomonas sp.]